MASIPISGARVSNYLRTTTGLSAISNTQRKLTSVEQQITNGTKFTAASEDPASASAAIQLQRTLARRATYASSISVAQTRLNQVDTALSDATTLLRQAQSIASANAGSDVSADDRQGAAAVVRSIYSQMLSLANTQQDGVFLFGGNGSGSTPYTESDGGVKYTGSLGTIKNVVGDSASIDVTVEGASVFGGTGQTVAGADLLPNLSAGTRLVDVKGPSGDAITRGSILVSDGTTSKLVDLSKAETVGDVLSAISATGLATASIVGKHLSLTGSATATLSVTEVGGGKTASDLGIAATAATGVAITGVDIPPAVTPFTQISDLRSGAGLDLAADLVVTNGTLTTAIDFTGAVTVEDVLYKINSAHAGVAARINAAGNGIDLVNTTQGTTITVSDTGGGTIAAELGVQTMSPSTPLAVLNDGAGVQRGAGPDFQITDKNGTTYPVDISSAATVQDVINAINTATGGTVTASFATTGNGIVLTDSSGGAGTLSVASLNGRTAATDLGISQTTTGTVLTGTDVNPLRTKGAFDDLLQLAKALEQNDQVGLTRVTGSLEKTTQGMVQARGVNGAKLQELENRADAITTQNLATKSLLSDLLDTDYTTAATQYQMLNTILQASYSVIAKTNQQSLLDFLK